MEAVRDIGSAACLVTSRVAGQCRYPFESDPHIARPRLLLASLSSVFAVLIGYSRNRRPDIPTEDFARSLLEGMVSSAEIYKAASTYDSMIISRLERKLFWEYSREVLHSEDTVKKMFSDVLSIPQLFAGIAYFRENAFRSFAYGDEDGSARRYARGLVSSVSTWLVPDSATEAEEIAFIEGFQSHFMTGLMSGLFSAIEKVHNQPAQPTRGKVPRG